MVAPLYRTATFGALRTLRRLETMERFEHSDTVVDIGGGAGRIANLLKANVHRIIVVDPSEGMISECRKQGGITCIVGSAEQLPVSDASADKVILIDAFHHVRGQEAAVQEIKRVLKENGSALIEEYDPLSFGGKLIVILEKILRMGSVFHSPESLTDLFSEHGFKVQIRTDGKRYYLRAQKQA